MLKGKSLTKLTNQKGIINQEKEGKKNEYLTKYREVEILGKGTQGTAHLVKSKVDLKFYVAKKIPLTILDEKKRTTFEQEFEILKQLHHPHIVSYVECFREESQMIVLIEYFEQGDLLFHLKLKIQEKEQLSEIVVMNWFSQLTMALDFIHEKGILHQNIKPSNIFLTKSGSIKLGDFGISSLLLSSKDKTATNSYSEKSDIWALGCILFEMCSLKAMRNLSEQIPSLYSQDLQVLVNILLANNPENRPRANQILSFPFVFETMKDFVSSKGFEKEVIQKIPIKKTHLHLQKENETRKGQSSSNSQKNFIVGKQGSHTELYTPIHSKRNTRDSPRGSNKAQAGINNLKAQNKNDILKLTDIKQVKNSSASQQEKGKKPSLATNDVNSQKQVHQIQIDSLSIQQTPKPTLGSKKGSQSLSVKDIVSPSITKKGNQNNQQNLKVSNTYPSTSQNFVIQGVKQKVNSTQGNDLQEKKEDKYMQMKQASPKNENKEENQAINQNQLILSETKNINMLNDSNVSFNLSLTMNSVFDQTVFKTSLSKQLPNLYISEEGEIEEKDDNDDRRNKDSANQQMKDQEIEENKNANGDGNLKSIEKRDNPSPEEEEDNCEEDLDVSIEEGDQENIEEEIEGQPPKEFNLTKRDIDKQLQEVLEMYKSQLSNSSVQEEFNKFKHLLNMSEIPEQSVEYSAIDLSNKFKDKLLNEESELLNN